MPYVSNFSFFLSFFFFFLLPEVTPRFSPACREFQVSQAMRCNEVHGIDLIPILVHCRGCPISFRNREPKGTAAAGKAIRAFAKGIARRNCILYRGCHSISLEHRTWA
ncbi:hypothetical protein HOY80DRAFT_636631 [Tuber brumale]|nr:hypothetical protein HOY80DRAFT_636631 [Tuber brumale]